MLVLGLEDSLNQALDHLKLISQERQFNFALSLALNATTRIAAKEVQAQMQQRFDRPTPQTIRSVVFTQCRKDDLRTKIGISEDFSKGTPPSKFLAAEIGGGDRNVKRSEMKLRSAGVLPDGWFTVPSKSAPVNQYGNIPGPIYTAIMADVGALERYSNSNAASRRERARRGKSTYFAIKPGDSGRLPPGIYERRGDSLRMILLFVRKEPSYNVRLPFADIVSKSVLANFPTEIGKAVDRAIATAR